MLRLPALKVQQFTQEFYLLNLAEGNRAPPNLKVRTSLTVGGLRDRVVKVFGLERFDIDVVVCRKGDRSRRQLKSSVRLSKYLVEPT